MDKRLTENFDISIKNEKIYEMFLAETGLTATEVEAFIVLYKFPQLKFSFTREKYNKACDALGKIIKLMEEKIMQVKERMEEDLIEEDLIEQE